MRCAVFLAIMKLTWISPGPAIAAPRRSSVAERFPVVVKATTDSPFMILAEKGNKASNRTHIPLQNVEGVDGRISSF